MQGMIITVDGHGIGLVLADDTQVVHELSEFVFDRLKQDVRVRMG